MMPVRVLRSLKSNMSKKRIDFDDLIETVIDKPFEILDSAFEALDDVFFSPTGDNMDLDKAMRNLDGKMKDLDRRLNMTTKKKKKNKLTFEYDNATVVVRYNSVNDIQINTTGNIDDVLMDIIRRRIREEESSKQESVPDSWETLREQYIKEEKVHTAFSARTWRGERGAPLDIEEGAHVSVSGHSMFGRKYTVEINGTTVYMVKIEELMERYWRNEQLSIFIDYWSPIEREVMGKIIDGLRHLNIIEEHHEGIEKLLQST